MRIVILGCGRVGATLATMMDREGADVTVIDSTTESFRRLGDSFQGQTILGNGIDEDILRRAGIEQADVFCALTNGDNRNIMASQIAKEVFQVKKVLCRIYDPIRQETFSLLGLDAICPTIVGAKLFREAILRDVPNA
jgi:trk system potassium uptake protein TrkA